MNVLKQIRLADAATLMNASCGILSVFYSINSQFLTASIFILGAVFLDFLDGFIARALKETSELGKELDSLADTISFGIAPAVFGFMLVEKSTILILVLIVFVLCGILRLARFNVTNIKYFEGMPITINGILFPLIYFLKVPLYLYPTIYFLSGILMISTFKLRKLR